MSILALTSDTLSSPAVAGQVEYSSPIFAATPIGTQRGVVPAAQFYRLDSTNAGANVNTAQNVLGVGVTLSSSTVYAFEAVYALSKSAGTTSHDFQLGFGGTATDNNIGYTVIAQQNNTSFIKAPTTSTTGFFTETFVQTRSVSVILSNISTAAVYFIAKISGVISVNSGGTFIPQYTLSAAPGGAYTTAANSYFLIYPIGAAGANTNVGTWA